MTHSADTPKPRLRFFNQFTTVAITWLWLNWLARGHLTLFVGDPDIGKTTLGLALASRASVGGTWPDGSPAPLLRTLILSAEDNAEETLSRLLDRHGADRSKVAVMDAVRDGGALAPIERQLSEIAAILAEHPFDIVQIYSLTSFLGESSRGSEAKMRRVLLALSDFAREYNIAIIPVMHPKTGGGGRKAIERLAGSPVFREFARCVWMAVEVVDETHDKQAHGALRMLGVAKINAAPRPKPLLWSLPIDQPVEWHGESLTDIDTAATRPDEAAMTDDRKATLDFIGDQGHPITPADFERKFNKGKGASKKYLSDMANAGYLTRPLRGFYDLARNPTLPPNYFVDVRARASREGKDLSKRSDRDILRDFINRAAAQRERQKNAAVAMELFGPEPPHPNESAADD